MNKDIQKIKDKLNDVHNSFLKKLPEHLRKRFELGTFYAGGCIRDLYIDQEPKDYDLFFYSELDKLDIENQLYRANGFVRTINKNYNIMVGGNKLQVITVATGNPKGLTSTFDFSINEGYYEPRSGNLYIPECLDTKFITVGEQVMFPMNALMRLPRFLKQGYCINHMELLKLAQLIQKLPDLTIPENIKIATMGLSFTPKGLRKARVKNKIRPVPIVNNINEVMF